MPPRVRAAVVAAAVALGPLLAGCTTDEGPRPVGDALSAAERQLLAGVLHRNFQEGGADVVVVATYGEAVLRLTGEVDFRNGQGRAEAETTFGGDRPDDVRTVVFSRKDLWVGDVPGLPEALGREAGETAYLRRPLADDEDPAPPLLDAVAHVLLRLAARSADEPEAFRGADYSWEGQVSIDSRLTTLFDLRHGTVAVGADDDLLRQYAAPVGDGQVQVTVTLSDHGRRRVEIPAAEETAPAADHPEAAAALGI